MVTYCRWPDIWHWVDKYFGRVVGTLGLALLVAVLGGEVGISPPNIAVVMKLTVFGNKIQELLVLHTLSQTIQLLAGGKLSNLCLVYAFCPCGVWFLELTFGDGKDSQDQKGYWLHGEFVKPNSQPHIQIALFYKTDLYSVSRSLLLILQGWWKFAKVVHSKNICATPKTEKLPRKFGPLFMHLQTLYFF